MQISNVVPKVYPSRLHCLWPLLFVAGSIWIAKSLFILTTPLRALAITSWLIDDSFITMQVARNLALGNGYSFDGVHSTSGTPLLWTLLSSLSHIFLDREAAAKVTILGSTFFGIAAAIMVFYLAYRLFEVRVAWNAFLLSLLGAPMFLNVMNGMETTLFTFLGLVAAALYINTDDLPESGRKYQLFATGMLLGLTNMTCGDGIFLSLAILLLEGFRLLKKEPKGIAIVNLTSLLTGIFIFTLLVVIWSFITSGSPYPANQVGRQFIAWQNAMLVDGTIIWPAYIRQSLYNIGELSQLLSITVGSTFVAGLALLSGLWDRRGIVLARLTILYTMPYFVTLIIYQGYFPNVHGLRYLNLPGHLLTIFIAAFCVNFFVKVIEKPTIGYRVSEGVILLLLLSSCYQYWSMTQQYDNMRNRIFTYFYTDEEVNRIFWPVTDWISQHLPDGAVIAVKDHGKIAYFTQVQVVDLAGIVDPSLVSHVKEGTMRAYLEERDVEYILIPKGAGGYVFNAIQEAAKEAKVEEIAGFPGGNQLFHVLSYD